MLKLPLISIQMRP